MRTRVRVSAYVNTLNTIMSVFVWVYKTGRKMINEPITLCGWVCVCVCVLTGLWQQELT